MATRRLKQVLDSYTGRGIEIGNHTDKFKTFASTAQLYSKMKTSFIQVKEEQLKQFKLNGGESLGNIGYGVIYHEAFQFNFTDFVLLDFCIPDLPPQNRAIVK